LKEVLEKQPDNIDALNYIINIESAFKQYDSALYYVDQGLHYYPDSKDFLFKKASVYADAKQYPAAYAITGDLYNNFPYNIRYRSAYIDQLLGSGQLYLSNNIPDSALMEFYKALAVSPNDTLPLYYTINLLIDQKQYDTALVLTERGRQRYPTNPFFLLKRATIYEKQKHWDDAWHSGDTLSKMTPLDLKNLEYARYLYSQRLKNEVGLFYLHSRIIDSATETTNSVATIQYTRRFNRGTITARINYAGRENGTGFQLEGECYYNHTPKWYSYGVAAYSPEGLIFPTYRLGYSIFHSFNHGWDGELGIRYLDADSGKILSGVASVSREINDFYFNLRGYYIELTNNTKLDNTPGTESTFYSAVLTARYYIDERSQYFSTIMGYGTAPDDFSQNYDITKLLSYKTVSVGAGYSKQIHFRTTVGVFASWYNEQLTSTVFRNQYDIYVSLLRRF